MTVGEENGCRPDPTKWRLTKTSKTLDLKSRIKNCRGRCTQESTVSAFLLAMTAQLPPHVPPVAPALTGPGPISYLQFYQGNQDALGGDYAPLYEPYDATSVRTPAKLRDRLLALSEIVPKVFLTLVIDDDGTYRTRTLHRVQRYQSHPVTASAWDGRVFAFDGNVPSGEPHRFG
jgi:hypothetical protein